ncbi:zinc-dependent alcohol dehydrogenase family protein [Cohnella zeiphila]|uniref:Zinc-dependent alcohol dehydrogenase family protein n=1 Tax=Cohnella zeiphila TaxID=2761120 RepID=A0A7X0STR8_9BACL|nr:zinc-dependent alcohol dehydrogenase family protein [Cohnella zeiphila]MBB6735950.1 zinc-dependent alcohol dehydrogenase family protein [Cohnella zeiphila]
MIAKCVRYDSFGDPCVVLQVTDKKVDRPSDGELLVRVTARPVNPSDLIPVRGAYAHRISLPGVPGYEGVGIVEDVGEAVSPAWLGKRVLPLRGEGTWQQYARIPARLAVPVPDGVDDWAAAQLYVNPLTAWLTCTETLGPMRTDDVLVLNAAGSSLGTLYAQLAGILGFRLLALARGEEHREELLRLGAERVEQDSDPSWPRAVAEMTNGRGAAAAVDCIGGPGALQLAACVRPGGALLSLGLLSGLPIDTARIVRDTGAVPKLFHLRHWNERATSEVWHAAFARLLSLAGSGRLALREPSAFFGLADVRNAVLAAEEASRRRGKVMLIG